MVMEVVELVQQIRRFTPQFPISDNVDHCFRSRYSNVQYVTYEPGSLSTQGKHRSASIQE